MQDSQARLGISTEITAFSQPVYNRSNVLDSMRVSSWNIPKNREEATSFAEIPTYLFHWMWPTRVTHGPEPPLRCRRFAYGYALDGSECPCYLVWPQRDGQSYCGGPWIWGWQNCNSRAQILEPHLLVKVHSASAPGLNHCRPQCHIRMAAEIDIATFEWQTRRRHPKTASETSRV